MTGNTTGTKRLKIGLLFASLIILLITLIASWAMAAGSAVKPGATAIIFLSGIALFVGLLRTHTWARLLSILVLVLLLLAGAFIEAVAHSVRTQWPLAGDWYLGLSLLCLLLACLYLLLGWPGNRKLNRIAFGVPFVLIIGVAILIVGSRCRMSSQKVAHNPATVNTYLLAGPNPTMDGFADTHTHPFANLAFGGCIFWGAAFGPEENALADCSPAHKYWFLLKLHQSGYEGSGSYSAWPKWDTFTHQQMYERWLYRAYMGGLRLMVMHAVNNEPFCRAAELLWHTAPGHSCDDPTVIRQELDAARQMEASIDSESGGTGKGWFHVVTSAQEARATVASGRLAVVLGIEADRPFRCQQTTCNSEQIKQELSEYYDLGVRHFFPIHLSDSTFGGMALYDDLFSLTNFALRGYAPETEDCSKESYGFRLTIRWPLKRMKATCNKFGLTDLGKALIQELVRKKMIIDIDHMSRKSIHDTLDITARAHYPVIAGHTSFLEVLPADRRSEYSKTHDQLQRIAGDDGVVAAGLADVGRVLVKKECSDTSRSWAEVYRYAVRETGGIEKARVALSSDQSFVSLIAPRFGKNGCDGPAPKPEHKSFPWDFKTQGMANLGSYPDFIQDLKDIHVTDNELKPLYRSAEAYIRMWETIEKSSGTAK